MPYGQTADNGLNALPLHVFDQLSSGAIEQLQKGRAAYPGAARKATRSERNPIPRGRRVAPSRRSQARRCRHSPRWPSAPYRLNCHAAVTAAPPAADADARPPRDRLFSGDELVLAAEWLLGQDGLEFLRLIQARTGRGEAGRPAGIRCIFSNQRELGRALAEARRDRASVCAASSS